MKRYSLIILILSFLVLYSNFSICSGENEDLKRKIEEKLKTLKRIFLQKQAMFRAFNEKLITENQQLSEENARLRQVLTNYEKEKVVYKPDPKQQRRIKKLEEKLSLLEELSQKQKKELQQELQTADELIASLQKQVAASKELVRQNIQLSQALKEADEEQSKLTREISRLKNRLQAKPKEKIIYKPDPEQEEEIQELNQKITNLKGLLQDKTQEIAQRDQRIHNLQQSLDNITQWLEGLLSRFP